MPEIEYVITESPVGSSKYVVHSVVTKEVISILTGKLVTRHFRNWVYEGTYDECLGVVEKLTE